MTYFIGIPAPIRDFDDLIVDPYTLIPIENRHLTLVYIGKNSLTPHDILSIKKALIRLKKFSLTFKGLFGYPSLSRPRYLATRPINSYFLETLRYKIMSSIKETTINDRYETFSPHVTIAYTRSKCDLNLIRVAEQICKRAKNISCILTVNKIVLYTAEGGKFRITEILSG